MLLRGHQRDCMPQSEVMRAIMMGGQSMLLRGHRRDCMPQSEVTRAIMMGGQSMLLRGLWCAIETHHTAHVRGRGGVETGWRDGSCGDPPPDPCKMLLMGGGGVECGRGCLRVLSQLSANTGGRMKSHDMARQRFMAD